MGFWFPWTLVLLVVAAALFTYITLLLVYTQFVFKFLHLVVAIIKVSLCLRCWRCVCYQRVRGCTFTGATRFVIQKGAIRLFLWSRLSVCIELFVCLFQAGIMVTLIFSIMATSILSDRKAWKTLLLSLQVRRETKQDCNGHFCICSCHVTPCRVGKHT